MVLLMDIEKLMSSTNMGLIAEFVCLGPRERVVRELGVHIG